MCTCLYASYHAQRPYIHIARYIKVLYIIYKHVSKHFNSEGNWHYPVVNIYIHSYRCIVILIGVAIHNIYTTTNSKKGSKISP